MKIVSLNTWGGKAGTTPLLEFFKRHKDADVFCLQEVWRNGEHYLDNPKFQFMPFDGVEPHLFEKITETLPNHSGYLEPLVDSDYGLAIFVKKSLQVIEQGCKYVYKEKGWCDDKHPGDHARAIQYITLKTESGIYTVINFHGIWKRGSDKLDIPDRIAQSENIISFTKTLNHPFILIGDFNLVPDGKSIQLFEEAEMRNLVKEHNVTSTRTRHYEKSGKFADYAFVSKEVEIKYFEVLPDEVSDHTPLLLEIK